MFEVSYYGFQIPVEMIFLLSGPGEHDEDAEECVNQISEWPEREQMELSLKECGAWDDLKTCDEITLKKRYLWVACCEIAEEME